MIKKWLVSQYDADTNVLVYEKYYRTKLMAMLMGWAVAGTGPGGRKYYSKVREVL